MYDTCRVQLTTVFFSHSTSRCKIYKPGFLFPDELLPSSVPFDADFFEFDGGSNPNSLCILFLSGAGKCFSTNVWNTPFAVETKSVNSPSSLSNCSNVLASPVLCRPITTHLPGRGKKKRMFL